MQDDTDEDLSDEPPYRDPLHIEAFELRDALFRLHFLGDDMFMRMQAFNLSIVDKFVMDLETDVLRRLIDEECTPIAEASFLSAQSQMWIFAAYEIIRTWRQRCRDIIKWSKSGGLELKLKVLEKDIGYPHASRQMRADQLRRVIADPSIIGRIGDDLRAIHIPFARMQAIRVSIAKHEVMGKKNTVALSPGYARINQWCGSLDYELENGHYSMGVISRRDIADGIRVLSNPDPLPDDKTLKEFDDYMRGSEVVIPDDGAA